MNLQVWQCVLRVLESKNMIILVVMHNKRFKLLFFLHHLSCHTFIYTALKGLRPEIHIIRVCS